VTDHRAAALALLEPLEVRLTTVPFLCGPNRAFTDIALFPFIRQFAGIDPDWFAEQPLPGVQAWLERLVTSDLFAAIMPKFTPWKAGDPPVLFGP
jgi:glutathione S-transferase